MPEYPDITLYVDAIKKRILGQGLIQAKLQNPFLLRTVEPNLNSFLGARVCNVHRLGKRVVLGFEGGTADLFPESGESSRWMVFHLMIAGRFHWKSASGKAPGKTALIILTFDNGYLYLTEAGSKRRASLHLFDKYQELNGINPGGLEVLQTGFKEFAEVITATNHTLKRALTDPHILSGIGNAYSDEILHRARLSPIKLSQKLSQSELQRLFQAIQSTLLNWERNLRRHYGESFPEKVTAFREDMAVHGRYGKPCPDCGAPVQRIRYATNETNYCPTCQTEGKILADRSLSRLLKKDWPRSLEELEKKKQQK